MNLTKPRGFRSDRCTQCNLIGPSCICAKLFTTECRTQIVILRHPNEGLRSSGTAVLALKCLAGATLLAPEGIDEFLATHDKSQIALLFPPDGEESLNEATAEASSLRTTFPIIIIPDGSWPEARRMVRKHVVLRGLPRVSPRLDKRWITKPLREDKWNRPCTAEAIGQWLQQVGDKAAAESLRHGLLKFVDAHWFARGKTSPEYYSTSEASLPAPEPSSN